MSSKGWKRHWSSLPLTRVHNIMKSAPGVQNLTPDAVAVATRFGELFIAGFCKEAYENKIKDEKDPSSLMYKDLTAIVHGEGDKESLDQYAFLQDIIPRKITVKEYREIMAREQQNEPGVDHGSDNEDRDTAHKVEDDDDEEENEEEGGDENGEAVEMDEDVEGESEDIEDEDEDQEAD